MNPFGPSQEFWHHQRVSEKINLYQNRNNFRVDFVCQASSSIHTRFKKIHEYRKYIFDKRRMTMKLLGGENLSASTFSCRWIIHGLISSFETSLMSSHTRYASTLTMIVEDK